MKNMNFSVYLGT